MKKILILLAAFTVLIPLAACRSDSPSGTMLSDAQRKAVLSFSEARMDNLLAGWNNNDYAVFSKDFDQDLLKSMTQEQFEKIKNDEFTGLGRFHSREVESVVRRSDGSYTVIYYAVFDNDDEVLVRVKFEGNGSHLISGLTIEK
jgi:hypothetical protein